MARFTKLRVSISKRHVPLESVDTHFAEQHAALQSKYECDTVFTDTGDTYTLHIHRHNKLRMAPNAVQQVLSDRYDPPEQFKNVTGVVMKKSGDIRTHGGARRGVAVKAGGGNSAKNNDRHEDFELAAIGHEEYTPDTDSIASALSMRDFYQTIQCFGVYLQMASFGNHNFSCSDGRAQAKYLPDGAQCWMTTSKKTVCRAVCMAWVTKLTEIVDGNNDLELDRSQSEPVAASKRGKCTACIHPDASTRRRNNFFGTVKKKFGRGYFLSHITVTIGAPRASGQ